jgi:hypothetical protein
LRTTFAGVIFGANGMTSPPLNTSEGMDHEGCVKTVGRNY